MKQTLITILRDKQSTIEQYRKAADQLADVMAIESAALLQKKNFSIETPLATTQGVKFNKEVLLVPILRSGLVLLPSFLRFYPDALVGFLGERRDEITAIPELYYAKFPLFSRENPIFLLDPMLATGGSAVLAVNVLKGVGAIESQITLISFIAAPEGIAHLCRECPSVKYIVAQVDEKLTPEKFIYPGLGDFGDRYFGTPEPGIQT